MDKPIRIALTKGRLEKDTVGLLEKLGFDCSAVRDKGRKLILPVPDANLEVVLAKADQLTAWVSDVKEYALQQALSGKAYRGWKLVEGRSNRKYKDEAAVARVVEEAGFDPYEKKLLGITAMTQTLGKKKFNELLGYLVWKPEGNPTLAPESDKRPAMNTAQDDFKEETNG